MTKDGSIVCAVLPGGGMAGAYTIQIIKTINDALLRQGSRFHDTIDIYFCTSTGAVIGGGLVAGMAVDSIYDLYMHGKDYFQYAAPWYIPNKLYTPRYKRAPILNCLVQNSNDRISMKMGEVYAKTKKHLMLSTVNKNYKVPLNECIDSWSGKFGDMSILDGVARSFAASIYFGNINDDKYQIVFGDGGEGDSNNPILEAYGDLCDMYPDKKIRMLNIGTGWYNKDFGYATAKKRGDLKDALEVPMMARGQATQTAVKFARRAGKRDKNFSFYHIDGQFTDEKMDVLDGLDYIIAYKNLALQTMTPQVLQETIDFLS